MDPGIFIFLVMLLSALPLYIIAYLIGVKKRVGLIAGSAPDRITNKTGLAHLGGLLIFMIGVVIVLMGLAICLFIGKALTITLAGVVLITVLIITLVVGIQRYVT